MKKASELGLFVTESKGAVFLTRKKLLILEDPEGVVIDLEDFVASSEKMGSFPLLVIEDEVEKLSESANGYALFGKPLGEKYLAFNEGFKSGYNKRSETHKYTEEDIILFCAYVDNYYANTQNTFKSLSELLKNWGISRKKELYIETRPVKQSRFISTAMHKYEPKIENGQLKAIWK